MKVSRNQLKSVVKECLMEILAEGLLHGESTSTNQSKKSSKKRQPLKESPEPQNTDFDDVVSSTVSSITNDSVMSSILADTAKTTYQEQLMAEKSPRASGMPVNESTTDLGGAFGESAARWASLAFPEKKQ